ncbi:hypothetical protein BGZ61DRAFT_569387 [Ilyonectria robusta]|uniref:uncharacterized protein n=1 Tax=Ilyonectria robusta TaxID=1079257 RepID=UPI001E8E20C5|nr:uncharacterized protein BGZ61DRAFT_569387 [Ilyonectria robusta]KAH8729682.1 hypothetical protein BGZ61DRAFT_569387 [Ilyonectria robusta]
MYPGSSTPSTPFGVFPCQSVWIFIGFQCSFSPVIQLPANGTCRRTDAHFDGNCGWHRVIPAACFRPRATSSSTLSSPNRPIPLTRLPGNDASSTYFTVHFTPHRNPITDSRPTKSKSVSNMSYDMPANSPRLVYPWFSVRSVAPRPFRLTTHYDFPHGEFLSAVIGLGSDPVLVWILEPQISRNCMCRELRSTGQQHHASILRTPINLHGPSYGAQSELHGGTHM